MVIACVFSLAVWFSFGFSGELKPRIRRAFVIRKARHPHALTSSMMFYLSVRDEVRSGALPLNAVANSLTEHNAFLLPTAFTVLQESRQLTSNDVPQIFNDGILVGKNEFQILLDLALHSGGSLDFGLATLLNRIESLSAAEHTLTSELASVKATVYLLAALPLVALTLEQVIGMQPLTWLFATNFGRLVLIAGTLAELAGVLWLNHIIRNARIEQV